MLRIGVGVSVARWLDEARRVPVPAVAGALGLTERRGSWSPCPLCGAEQRSKSKRDRRAPLGVRRDGLGWECQHCHETGDALDLAGLVLHGDRFAALDREHTAEVRGWYASRGWCEARGNGAGRPQTPRPAAPPPPKPEPPPRPDPEEVAAAWELARPVTRDREVAAWLAGRGLDPARVEDFDLARALPADARLPRWAVCRGVPWLAGGYRLVVQGWSSTREPESLHARCILASPPPGPRGDALPKSAWPAGYAAAGLVMACGLGRQLLQTGELPSWWPAGELLRVVIAEGLPDFLTWAPRFSDGALDAPAVFGVTSGGWAPEIGARVPSGTKVAIRTDRDRAGDAYAWRAVWQSLVPRLGLGNVVRPRAPAGMDDNDLLRAGRLPWDPFEDVEE